MTKKLFVITNDQGDGSRGVHFTFNQSFIDALQKRYDNGELDYDSLGCDGDGFSYKVLSVPEECTLESLGIRYDCADSYASELEIVLI